MNYMLEALRLAELGKYSVAPNPLVGCVIEKNGKIVGRGWHQKVGAAHAEIMALNEAREKAQGANLYVTLEPCCHYGNTPPCVDALIAAKIKSVHIPFIDPNPLVNGKSVALLRAAGIEVQIGEAADVARKQNEVFLHYITTKQPFVVGKWAMTLDGRIASDTGDAKWISNLEARTFAHYTRCQLGAVLVGAGTVIADNPKLTPYLVTPSAASIKYPLRIVLDAAGKIPLNAKVFEINSEAKTLVATIEKSSAKWRQTLIKKDVEVLVLPEIAGHVDLFALLEALGKKAISGVLVEGGQAVLTSFVKNRLLNKLHIYIAPKIIGGCKNFAPLGDLKLRTMQQAVNLTYESIQSLNDNILIKAIPRWENICSPE